MPGLPHSKRVWGSGTVPLFFGGDRLYLDFRRDANRSDRFRKVSTPPPASIPTVSLQNPDWRHL